MAPSVPSSLSVLSLTLLLTLSLSLPGRVCAKGLVVHLYNKVNGTTATNVTTVVVTPNPSVGTYPGCFDLPKGFSSKSGRFTWQATPGTSNCSYFVFYSLQHCFPSADVTEQAVKAATGVTVISDFSLSRFTNRAPNAPAVGCAYAANPCVTYPCNDRNALCLATTIIVNDTSSNKLFSQFTARSCSTCKMGFDKIRGKCIDLCANVSCAAPAVCVKNVTAVSASCQCPPSLSGVDYLWNATTQRCDDVGVQRWKDAINRERRRAKVPDLRWNATLAAKALDLARQNNVGCPDSVTPPFVREAGVAQNGYFDRSRNDQEYAVSVWMSILTNQARMLSPRFTQFGCGKALCGGIGAMFLCQFK